MFPGASVDRRRSCRPHLECPPAPPGRPTDRPTVYRRVFASSTRPARPSFGTPPPTLMKVPLKRDARGMTEFSKL